MTKMSRELLRGYLKVLYIYFNGAYKVLIFLYGGKIYNTNIMCDSQHQHIISLSFQVALNRYIALLRGQVACVEIYKQPRTYAIVGKFYVCLTVLIKYQFCIKKMIIATYFKGLQVALEQIKYSWNTRYPSPTIWVISISILVVLTRVPCIASMLFNNFFESLLLSSVLSNNIFLSGFHFKDIPKMKI